MKDAISAIVFFIFFISTMFSVLYWIESTSCANRWKNSPFKSEYAILQGCLIEIKDGVWIPADNYREM